MKDNLKKKNWLLKVIIICLLMILAIVVIVTASRGRENGLKGVWDAITGGEATREFYYENSSGGYFETLSDGSLAVMSNAGLYVFEESGEESITRLFNYAAPALYVSGDYGVACDIGGTSVVFFSSQSVILELETKSPVISASVNEDGYLCVCTEESGYMGSVTVYNPKGTDIYKWYSGSSRVLSADVRGHSDLMVLTVGEGGSSLIMMPLTSEQETARMEAAQLILDAWFTDKGVTALTTNGVLYLTGSFEERGTYDFQGRYLQAFSVSRDSLALLLSDYQVGGDRLLVSVDTDGRELGSAQADGAILDIDVSEDAVAVLYSGYIRTYGLDMTAEGICQCPTGTEQVIILEDGGVLAAGAFSATVCVPGEDDGTASQGELDE